MINVRILGFLTKMNFIFRILEEIIQIVKINILLVTYCEILRNQMRYFVVFKKPLENNYSHESISIISISFNPLGYA
jgi:hypothetical protein